ncbi:phosphatase PAP2 family protein [Paenibacillus arenilitoris]|uniref:Phosphatase PAP2 family protein n=1 Tax=Paenibacillus arenilitoris TaxID=2772299 RepID=A0A927H6R5_9BACL|nr:phosphatase PAP2 family protein [Paenibacillus arenilitoris]MBD2870841.1 phosphatase PAP2 family protein [Paenibacillus arenilitoris]
MHWLKRFDHRVLVWCNRTMSHAALDRFFGFITHMGGAAFTIISALMIAGFAAGDWKGAGLQCALALTVSHLIAVLIKKKVRRLRPFRRLSDVRVGNFPLKDYSFPSGHTTAIFSIVTPLLFLAPPAVSMLMIALAVLVGVSRIYWGYHYPTDCAAGGAIGIATGIAVAAFLTI